MRNTLPYKIMRLAGGIVFVCKSCDFKVKVEPVVTAHRGSGRTVAALQMNQHIESAHP